MLQSGFCLIFPSAKRISRFKTTKYIIFFLKNILHFTFTSFTEASKMEYFSTFTKQTNPLILSRFVLFRSESYDEFHK